MALAPLLLFLALFFGAGLYYTTHGEAMGFYQLRAPVAILPALALAAFIAWRRGLKPLETLLSGMGDHNVVLMCLIFLLAGGFVEVSKAIGAVDAIVALGVGHVHPALLFPVSSSSPASSRCRWARRSGRSPRSRRSRWVCPMPSASIARWCSVP